MKLTPAKVEGFLRTPPATCRIVLIYGPDEGLVSERAKALVERFTQDPADPFAVSVLKASQLRQDPAQLLDEVTALSLTGGARVVLVEEAGEALSELLPAVLEAPEGSARVIVKAGDLPAKSSLRKLAEKEAAAAALPCYRDEGATLGRLASEHLKDAGLTPDRDALAFLQANLGGDRQATRRELEKLVCYMGNQGPAVSLADVQAVVGDSALLTLDDLAFAVASGDLSGLERRLAKLFQEGTAAITVLRAASRHFQRLQLTAGLVDGGQDHEDAVKRLRPPVFWKYKDTFLRQSKTWPRERLAESLAELLRTEAACKKTGAPAELLTQRCLLALAAKSPTRRGRSR